MVPVTMVTYSLRTKFTDKIQKAEKRVHNNIYRCSGWFNITNIIILYRTSAWVQVQTPLDLCKSDKEGHVVTG